MSGPFAPPPRPIRGVACLDPMLDAWGLEAARIAAEQAKAQRAIREEVLRLRELPSRPGRKATR